MRGAHSAVAKCCIGVCSHSLLTWTCFQAAVQLYRKPRFAPANPARQANATMRGGASSGTSQAELEPCSQLLTLNPIRASNPFRSRLCLRNAWLSRLLSMQCRPERISFRGNNLLLAVSGATLARQKPSGSMMRCQPEQSSTSLAGSAPDLLNPLTSLVRLMAPCM